MAFKSVVGGKPGVTTRKSNHNHVDARYNSDTASLIDSSSYQDASSQRDSDQDSIEFRASQRHFSSDSESEASSIIDRFRHCEPRTEKIIPRFQQSTASTRGRQRQIDKPADRTESRGPRSGRGESREPGRRGPTTRGQSQEPGYRRQSREPGPRRGLSREPVTTRGEPRGVSREPVVGRRAVSREPGVRRRDESREPGGRSYGSETLEGRRGDVGNGAGPGAGGARNSWADTLRQSSDFRGRSDRSESKERSRRRSESQEPGRRKRSESQEPGRRRTESREPVHGRHRRSESQGPALHHFVTSNDVAEERTIRAVHAQLKDLNPPDDGEHYGDSLYDAMRLRSEVRRAVSMELSREQPELRDMYVEELQESENRRLKLLAQLAEEEEARRELAQIVKNMSSDQKPKPTKAKSYQSEREYISKELDEEALRFFDEFASISTSEPEDLPAEKHSAKPIEPKPSPAVISTPPAAQPRPTPPAEQRTEPKSSAAAEQRISVAVARGSPAKSVTESSKGPSETKTSTEITPAAKSTTGFSSERSLRSSSKSSVSKPVSASRQSGDSSGKKSFPSWKTGMMAVNTDGVVMPWLDWEPEVGTPRFGDAMFATGMSRSYPCNTIGDIDWKALTNMIPRAPEREDVHAVEELFMQRIRFHGRLEAGRIHLCRREF